MVVVEKWHKLSESRVRVYSRREFGLSSFYFFGSVMCVPFFVLLFVTSPEKENSRASAKNKPKSECFTRRHVILRWCNATITAMIIIIPFLHYNARREC